MFTQLGPKMVSALGFAATPDDIVWMLPNGTVRLSLARA